MSVVLLWLKKIFHVADVVYVEIVEKKECVKHVFHIVCHNVTASYFMGRVSFSETLIFLN
jgi:hypothetical protein